MAQSQPDVHSIRITSQGKIKNWVSFALNSFQENPDLPLAFHTISPKVSKGKKDAKKLASSAALVPRLLTVVEIVKREYLRDLATRRSPRMKGLHQYNEIGTLEDTEDTKEEKAEGGADEEQERAKKIVEAVSGKNHVRQTQTPFMRVTLSTCELPHLEAAGATFVHSRLYPVNESDVNRFLDISRQQLGNSRSLPKQELLNGDGEKKARRLQKEALRNKLKDPPTQMQKNTKTATEWLNHRFQHIYNPERLARPVKPCFIILNGCYEEKTGNESHPYRTRNPTVLFA
ncbi:hypothetical protein D9611_013344 [Ephemerocybe angulata]|uniref:Uncharacterized protein n=1 Tax=Ephemerocybe angulata TaxID=980116 RepID=A0A8H5CBP1_9AGAR|nr:hypothetical protein D9611_013344 [Tulosesus angulatus]